MMPSFTIIHGSGESVAWSRPDLHLIQSSKYPKPENEIELKEYGEKRIANNAVLLAWGNIYDLVVALYFVPGNQGKKKWTEVNFHDEYYKEIVVQDELARAQMLFSNYPNQTMTFEEAFPNSSGYPPCVLAKA